MMPITRQAESAHNEEVAIEDDNRSVSTVASRSSKSIKAFYSPVKLSSTEENSLNLAFLRALVSGGVAFNFADDYYLSEWLRMIKPTYVLPSRTTLTDNHLVQLYTIACVERDSVLKEGDCFTCLWDGWTDVSHNSIYALMLLHNHESSELLDVINVSKERHTATNMVTMVRDIFDQCAVEDMMSIKCLVTDSPSVMIKFRREMIQEYPHLIGLPCALHVANTLCKDVCRVPKVAKIVKVNCKLVNFFTASHLWFAKANDWAKANNEHKYAFQSLCETRWYSMTKVCLSIQYYKAFLEDVQLLSGTVEEYPQIRRDVLECINDRHFVDNKEVVEVISPIADLIGQLEKARTTVADIVVEFVKLHICYKKMQDREIHVNPFVKPAMDLLSKRYKQYFTDPIYIVALFLSPKYRDFSVSKHFTVDAMVRECVKLGMKWKLNRKNCTQLAQDLTAYAENEFTSSQKEMTQCVFWKCTTQFSPCTRMLAQFVFKLKGHAAPVETLFSSLSYSKPKIRNKLSSTNLKILGVVRKSLKKNIPAGQNPKKRTREGTIGVNLSINNEIFPELNEDQPDGFDFAEEFDRILEDDEEFASFIDVDIGTALQNESHSFIEELFAIDKFDMDNAKNQTDKYNNDSAIELNEEEFTLEDIMGV